MKLRRRLRDERGQSLTEFALLAPLLLLLVFGIFDLGRLFYGTLHLQMAAQETVRLGGLGRTDSQMRSFASSYINLPNAASAVITVTPEDSVRDSGDYVTVRMEVPYQFVTPLIGNLFPGVTNVTAESTIRVE